MQKSATMTITTTTPASVRTDYARLIKNSEELLLNEDSSIVYGADMREHTTFKIGGPADAFIEEIGRAHV